MSNTKAFGLFSLKVKENNGPEFTVPTDLLHLTIKPDKLLAGGFDSSTTPPPWGAQFLISEKIEPGTYTLKSSTATAFYNPKTGDSWSAIQEGGEITLDVVDFEEKFVKGSFMFTAVDKQNPQNTAAISGTFSLNQ
ncbi:DUF6252 family protein [Pseudomonas sp. FP2196]|uniref:DUF6252 family protein n=1 Tax=Pseudomonas sp. FP2196 TaxID=2954086 RepID=UPI0027343850|nr:DUF6252 family protein [Pseudomonas sp. FP2196]WLH34381.1 DUF6252 family protein [Pseudomonas sp. FP2196]